MTAPSVRRLWPLLLAPLLAGCGAGAGDGDGYRVVASYPHDRTAYTQGLLFHDGQLYESTGLRGRSSLRRVALDTGEVRQQRALDRRLFGEGLVLFRGVLIQLTWQAGIAIVYDSDTFRPLRLFTYDGEGWGLTHDGERLIMSDGSARLTFRDPSSFAVLDTLAVTDGGRPVALLNELEYIKGEIWANIYQSNDIVRIDPATGRVRARLNFDGLLDRDDDRYGGEDVLNGIAYDAAGDRIFITGKLYAKLYQIAPDTR